MAERFFAVVGFNDDVTYIELDCAGGVCGEVAWSAGKRSLLAATFCCRIRFSVFRSMIVASLSTRYVGRELA